MENTSNVQPRKRNIPEKPFSLIPSQSLCLVRPSQRLHTSYSLKMQTRPSLATSKRQRYIRPKPLCPLCQQMFYTYHEVYLHALETHKQALDATFTCETCFQVCRNHKGLEVHRTYTHRERPWKLALQNGKGGDTPYKQRRVAATGDNDTPVQDIKLEVPATAYVTCPACAQAFSKAEMETHISEHDEEVVSAYSGLSNAVKRIVAELVMEMTSVRKTEG